MALTVRKAFWLIAALTVLFPAQFVFAETIELVTYYPAPANAGNEHVNDFTVGPGYLAEDPADGVAIIETALGIGTNNPQQQLEITGNFRFPATTIADGTPQSGVFFRGGRRFFHTNGIDNLFFGQAAGNFTLTGNNLIGIGVNALQRNTSGDQNTAVGNSSLLNNQDGGNNTAVGTAAISQNTAGSNNAALGSGTLGFNTIGSGNTAVGFLAGTLNTGVVPTDGNAAGTNNTFVGFQSGPGADMTLTNATAIGANALVSANNALVLGGTGVNAVSVGIGTAQPTATLDVNSGAVRVSRNASDAAASAAPQNGMVYYNTTTNNYRAYQNGRWVDLSPTRPSVYIEATSSDLLTSTTYADDAELQLLIGAGERWHFEIVALARVYVDTDLKFKLAGPGAGLSGDISALATMFKTGNAAGGPGVASSSYWSCILGTYADEQVVNFTSDGFVHIFINGHLRNSAAAAGTFRIQWALRTPPGGNGVIWRNRYLRATRIS
jgi:hypothetical protein